MGRGEPGDTSLSDPCWTGSPVQPEMELFWIRIHRALRRERRDKEPPVHGIQRQSPSGGIAHVNFSFRAAPATIVRNATPWRQREMLVVP